MTNIFEVGKTYEVRKENNQTGFLKIYARVNIEGKDWVLIRFRDNEYHRRTRAVLVLNFRKEADSEALEFGGKDDKFLSLAKWKEKC